MSLESLVSYFGVPALFLGCLVEGESVAITGGALVHRHMLPFVPVLLAIGSGAWVADTLFFWLGRRFRAHLFVQRQLAGSRIASVMGKIRAQPGRFAALFRFIPGMRILFPFALAQTQITYRRYGAITAASAAIWAMFYIVVGHLVGAILARVLGHIHHAHVIVWGGGIAATLSVLLAVHHLRRGQKRRQ
ncbi:hypothetical protein A8B82_09360 [Sulfitobacter sp. EhC04]|uniref:DedA family protein n=1 Tax=Sulfitobacter sp. EhC04 TaxID=1849168 RepID=UPI0007F5013F|nr:DedA family protein [Sulfitobacter sp. EhC04]OAN78568.1 hypothetical protein A8B82_09360 [Sulfitobacter sp. EhC04]